MANRTQTFICGCGHSGTSLLANMFASHPAVYIPLRETETFLSEENFRQKWEVLAADWSRSAKHHLVEKTPRHLRNIERIRAMLPSAKFVLMVRDGRDVAASYIKRAGSATPGAKRWIADNTIVFREIDAPDVTVVRYEELIGAPRAVLRRICSFIGLDFAEEMLSFYETRRLWFGVKEIRKGTGADGVEHRLLRNWQINQPLFDGRGQWRNVLSADDLAIFETSEVRALMRSLGYDETKG
jgi:hypothetical protein